MSKFAKAKEELKKFVRLKTTQRPAFVDVCEEALDAADHYRFHDLRIDYEDLPDENVPVIYYARGSSVYPVYHGLAEYEDGRWYVFEDSAFDAFVRDNIYGWRYVNLSEGDE